MAKPLVVLAILVAALGLAPPATGQVPETVSLVATAAQYRSALTTLSADSSPGPHTVRLSADITLVADIEPIYTGTQALIIDGDGHTIDGNDLNRAIDHQSNASLTLQELTIRNGHTPTGNDGGAVATDGPLTITGVTFEDNVAESNGGALETAAGDAVTITDSTFTGNTAENIGGAIESNSPLTITGSTFSENVIDDPVSSSQGGGALSQGAGKRHDHRQHLHGQPGRRCQRRQRWRDPHIVRRDRDAHPGRLTGTRSARDGAGRCTSPPRPHWSSTTARSPRTAS